ncbi:alpha/beta hydrolase [Streptomyces sp. M19]
MTDADAWGIPELAAWVAEYIEANASRPVFLVGHSTGGAIALRTALSRPDLLHGLMLVNTGSTCAVTATWTASSRGSNARVWTPSSGASWSVRSPSSRRRTNWRRSSRTDAVSRSRPSSTC